MVTEATMKAGGWMPAEDNDEGYWQAILEQGEFAPSLPPPEQRRSLTRRKPAGGKTYAGSYAGDHNSARGCDNSAGAPVDATEYSEENWQWLQECYEKGEVLSGRVVSCNRGGLLVRIQDVVGFVPASQLEELPAHLGTNGLVEELERMVGRELQLRLIELDQERNRIILSERATAWPAGGVESLLNGLEEGQKVRGRVRSLCEFGAFIDLGGIDGLVHISELSWQRIEHPRDVLQVGQEVELLVLNVDPAQRKVGLSLKRLTPDPWATVEERYQVGQLIQGTITNVVDFGAFVRIEEGLEGLIHISELAEGNFLHPRNVVREGEVVTVRVLNIDGRNRRLGLSLRRACTPEPLAVPAGEMGQEQVAEQQAFV
jgi:small subunit ribosomal protein S1